MVKLKQTQEEMKFIKLLCMASVLLLYAKNTHAQIDRATKQLRSKLSVANHLNYQLTEENKNLHSYLRQLNQIISNVRDSINLQIALSKKLDFESRQWQESAFNVNKTLQETQKDLDTAQEEIRKLTYENVILKDPSVVRIYDISAAKVKEALINRLSERSLGFQFNEDATKGNIKITKIFDKNTEEWWILDKSIDVLLELELRVVLHQYDPNRSIIYSSTNLFEKAKNSNNEYTPQEDIDKIRIYEEKVLRVLERSIRKSNLK